MKIAGWLRKQGGAALEALDPVFVPGTSDPGIGAHGATYDPLFQMTDSDMEALYDSRRLAMRWTAQAALPEAGIFAAIAQSLDAVINDPAGSGKTSCRNHKPLSVELTS